MVDKTTTSLFELFRIAVGKQCVMSSSPTCEEWKLIYDATYKQSLFGICFYAISKLPEGQRPNTEFYFIRW